MRYNTYFRANAKLAFWNFNGLYKAWFLLLLWYYRDIAKDYQDYIDEKQDQDQQGKQLFYITTKNVNVLYKLLIV